MTIEELTELIAHAEWEFNGVHPPFRIEPANRHRAIAEAVAAAVPLNPPEKD